MLPDRYKEGIERVSNIVSFVFPFDWNSKQRYLDWLSDNVDEKFKRWFSINEKEYMDEAQVVWTFIHLQMEKHILWEPLDKNDVMFELHNKEIKHWLEYIDWLEKDGREFLTEVYVRDEQDRFQWAMDFKAVHHKKKKVKLFDWKTWGIAKKRWGLPNVYRKPYSKIKKLQLQLSLYAETDRQKWYEIEWLYWIWLHHSWAYEYEIDAISSEEINDILKKFENRNALFINNKYVDMKDLWEWKIKISTHVPTGVQFEYVAFETEVDLSQASETISKFAELRNFSIKEYVNARNKLNEEINGV